MKYKLFKVGKIWHYRFQVDGSREQRSTFETDRSIAEKVAARAFREATLWARNGRKIPTMQELVAEWLSTHKATASQSHWRGIDAFCRLHLYGLEGMPIDEITTTAVEQARCEYLKDHAPTSANHWLKTVRLLINWAVRRKIIPTSPFVVLVLKIQKKPRVVLPVPLAQAWMAALDERAGRRLGIRIAVRLMIGLGLREAETHTARWEWMDWDRRTYTPGETKGREADPLPCPNWLIDFLMPYRQATGPIVTKPTGQPYTPGFTRHAMLCANKAVGAPHVTPHRLRATYATLLSESGVPVQNVQKALRHKSALTTMGYLESSMDSVSRGQERIGEKLGFGLRQSGDGAPVAMDAPQ
ncbi:tyrosine-type recombinase/integrase [Paraburkholderia lacunae]|uniref:Integrase n=1 Tax=Paraburkholderia lacunae TaxID=2211104 RepID=A0A370N7M5_9BURK|nr:tyrosine-type recombinase/integrase [Paraburkholderia lacunae]RDK01614.1 integrase [Paraburkholderia lacunae]